MATGEFRSGLDQIEISLLLGIQSVRVFTEGGSERSETHKEEEADNVSV